MTTLTPNHVPDHVPDAMPATALPDLLRYLCAGEDPHGTVADDVVAHFNFPHSTFTLHGRADLDALRDQVSDRPWVAHVERVDPTPTGFVVVAGIDVVTRSGESESSRTVTLVTVDAHHITALDHWCTGAL